MSAGSSQPTKRDASPFLRPHVLSGQVFDNPYREVNGLVGSSARTNKEPASRGLQRTTGSGGSGMSALGASLTPTNPYSVQVPHNLLPDSQLVTLVLYPGAQEPWLIDRLPCIRQQTDMQLMLLQIIADSRKNSFSAPDEVLLERKGSADSQSSLGPDRPFGEVPVLNDRLADPRGLVRHVLGCCPPCL